MKVELWVLVDGPRIIYTGSTKEQCENYKNSYINYPDHKSHNWKIAKLEGMAE